MLMYVYKGLAESGLVTRRWIRGGWAEDETPGKRQR